ncbi:forkhead box protein B1-like [Parambassis ranga]|uniref:Forkhead box protein B1-like n=1 Tax=Parambassis ranga TaxID=210632 RepID=A0A6P7KH42_9TELE|nr:forkhead box protein B1-like [Parambassis ranga]
MNAEEGRPDLMDPVQEEKTGCRFTTTSKMVSDAVKTSEKLNLGSIYRAMEQQFPYLRSRGTGWRNSVRHNLSVNDCFVKVSRCEDGRGHYWGVHQAHLRDFQHGNFKRYRTSRGRKERDDGAAGCLAWMETSCFLRRFCEHRSESLAWLGPRCPLQEPRRNQMSSLDWTPSWMRHYYCTERAADSNSKITAGRRQGGQTLTSRVHYGKITHPVLRGMAESYDGRFTGSQVQALRFPPCCCCCCCCCCMSPGVKEFINPFAYKV